MYVHELNPVREAFFQKPKADFKFSFTDPFWYRNKPLGVNQLSKMMKEMCLGGKLSKTYTNHCYLPSHSGGTRAFQLITSWVFQAMPMSRGSWYFICRHVFAFFVQICMEWLSTGNKDAHYRISLFKNCQNLIRLSMRLFAFKHVKIEKSSMIVVYFAVNVLTHWFKTNFYLYKFHCLRIDGWNTSTTDALWFVYILSWVLKIL